MSYRQFLSSSILCLVACFTCFAQAQTPSFSAHTATINSALEELHCDLNNDGYEDLVVMNSNSPGGYVVLLSNGDGTYRAPIAVPTSNLSGGLVAFGDFNGDGNLDLVGAEVGVPSSFTIYFGNGDGTFRAPVVHAVSANLEAVAVADVNHDNKTDLLLLTTTDGTATSDFQVLFSKGDGTFTTGPTTHILLPGAEAPLIGDFDGDGKADVVLFADSDNKSQQFEIFSGDGAGHFTETYSDSPSYLVTFVVGDVNGDGISDLIGTTNAPGAAGPGPNGAEPFLTVFYGSSDRKMTLADIQTTVYPFGPLTVADFNGDHIPDIAFLSSTAQSVYQVNILSGKGNKEFGPMTSVYTLNAHGLGFNDFGELYGLRGNRDTKADLTVPEQNTANGTATLVTLLNTTAGSFPTCAAPNAAVGIAMCSPSTSSAVSPVSFAVGAAGDTPMRDVDVWVDGKKVAEQLTGAFSNYSFLNASVALAAGSHKVTVYGIGWDGSHVSKVSTLDVTSSSCSVPTAAGVHICAPASGATVSSPVQVQAAAKVTGTISSTQLWVDGVKKYTAKSSTTLNTSISLAAGSHRFAVLAQNTAGQKWESAVNATVK